MGRGSPCAPPPPPHMSVDRGIEGAERERDDGETVGGAAATGGGGVLSLHWS